MSDYCKLQIEVIKRYARFLQIDPETAALQWIHSGLAKKFALKHREQFGMMREAC